MQPAMHVESQPSRHISSLERLRTVLQGAGEHLGDMVWWALSDASLKRSDLERIWQAAGLGVELLPEPPTPEKALRLAVRSAQLGQSDHLIRAAKDSEGELIYAVVREERLGEGVLAHRQEARVILEKTGGTVSSDMPSHPLAQAVLDAFSCSRNTHTADDVRRTLVKTLRTYSAVTLREGGGVYWVPRTFAAQLRQLEQAVRELGSSQLYVVPIHQTAATSKTLGAVAKGSLEAELAALKEELEEFKAVPPDRPATLERRLETFDQLRSRGQLYRDILQVEVDDLEEHLDAMAASIQELISGRRES